MLRARRRRGKNTRPLAGSSPRSPSVSSSLITRPLRLARPPTSGTSSSSTILLSLPSPSALRGLASEGWGWAAWLSPLLPSPILP